MTTAMIAVPLGVLVMLCYRRYVPVAKIGNMPLNSISYNRDDIILVDTRDFQVSFRDTIDGSYQLPIPYLKRYSREIPSDKQIVIVASDYEGKNLGARCLKQKGKNVVGYHLVQDK